MGGPHHTLVMWGGAGGYAAGGFAEHNYGGRAAAPPPIASLPATPREQAAKRFKSLTAVKGILKKRRNTGGGHDFLMCFNESAIKNSWYVPRSYTCTHTDTVQLDAPAGVSRLQTSRQARPRKITELSKKGIKDYGHSPKRNIEKKSATIVLAWPAAAGGCARVGYMHATVFLPRRVSIGLACHEIFTHHQFTSVTLFNKLSIKLLFRVVDFYHYCCSTAGSDEPMRYGLRSHTASAM